MKKGYGLDKWNDKTLDRLNNIGKNPDAPTTETLKARYELFLSKVDSKNKQKELEQKKAKTDTGFEKIEK